MQVWAERRRGLAGSRLHVRLVMLFSLVAVIPTIIVAVFSYMLFSFGVQAWFSERVRTALQQSLAVAEAYLHEHQQTIRDDVVSMANDLEPRRRPLIINPAHLNELVNAQAALALLERSHGVRRQRPRAGAQRLHLLAGLAAAAGMGAATGARRQRRGDDQRQ